MKTRKKNDFSNSAQRIKPWPIATLERFETRAQNDSPNHDAHPEKTPAITGYDGLRIHTRSHRQIAQIARKFASYLISSGVAQGDKIIVDLPVFIDIFSIWAAILYAGAIPVFLPPDRSNKTACDAIVAAGSENGDSVIIITTRAHLDQNTAMLSRNLPIRAVVCTDDAQSAACPNGDAGIAAQDEASKITFTSFERAIDLSEPCAPGRRICPHMPIAVTYTQGTQGGMRPIEISNVIIESQSHEISDILKLSENSVVFCDFPAIHTLTLVIWAAALSAGAHFSLSTPQTACNDKSDFQVIADAMIELRPTHAFLRPHVLSDILRRIQSPHTGAFRNKWRRLCLKIGKFKTRNDNKLLKWSHPVIQSACTRPIRNNAFPHVRTIISYGNHFVSKDAELLSFLDLPVCNAYAVAEFGIVHLHEFKAGGSFLKTIEAKIKCGNLYIRHKKIPSPFIDMHDLVFEDDCCGLCTRPNAFVTLNSGRTVNTSPLCDDLERYDIIGNAFIFGDQKPFLTALVYLNPDEVRSFARHHKLPRSSFESYAQNPILYAHIRDIVQKCNLTRAPYESVQKFAILPLTIDDDPQILTLCKTPRTALIAVRYAHIIESFYADNF